MVEVARILRRFPLLCAGLLVLGCGPNGPVQSTTQIQQPPGASTGQAPVKDDKPDFVFDVPTWRDEWKNDREAAKKKYTGKIVELTGEVIYVMVAFEGSLAGRDLRSGPGGWVNLKNPNGSPVTCTTTDPQPWLTVSEGSKIRIRGRAGKANDEDLVDCVIVEAGPSSALAVTVEEITAAVAADLGAAEKKYDKKYAHITGEVTEVVKDKDGTVKLKLKGASGVGAYATLGVPAAHRAGTIQVGQTIRLFSEVLLPTNAKGEVSLSGGVVTRDPGK